MNDVVTARLALIDGNDAVKLAAITNDPGFKADAAHSRRWQAAQAAAFQAAKPFADELAELCGAHHAPDSGTAKRISKLKRGLREVELEAYARHGFTPAPAMPTVAAPPAMPDGDDDPEWRPASWFAYDIHARLRMAARPNRLTKRVGKKVVDGAILYSAADARRYWPDDVVKKIVD